MSLYELKMPSLRDKLAAQAQEVDKKVEKKEVVKEVKKRRLNK